MKPMLAARLDDVSQLKFPLLASAKLDGVRAIVRGGCVLSRTLKPIPNHWVQEQFHHLEGHDGELIVGSPTAKDVYRQTVSGVMTEAGKPPVVFSCFDIFTSPHLPYRVRLRDINPVHVIESQLVKSLEELLAVEEQLLKVGYEGVILRDPGGAYKFGRSTINEHGMVKLKRFTDDEAYLIGMEELCSNQNEAKINALGHTERSSHKENQVPMGTMGALICQWLGKEFRIGTGFTAAERQVMWDQREALVGKIVKFKFLQVGMKDLPRHPVFLGFREGD
jgi:DNA ligase-1